MNGSVRITALGLVGFGVAPWVFDRSDLIATPTVPLHPYPAEDPQQDLVIERQTLRSSLDISSFPLPFNL